MILDASCDIRYENAGEVPAVFMLRPRSGWAQWILEDSFLMSPMVQTVEYADLYGNLCQRLVMPAGNFNVHVRLRADVPDLVDVDENALVLPVAALPPEVMHYLLPSRYCQSDRFGSRVNEIPGVHEQNYRAVESIRSWIQRNVIYQYGTSDASTSAVDTFQNRVGVCRDFAHLGIALCRSVNIPARMVVGFLHQLEPMDLHAWFEAYLDGRWFTFDATQDEPRGNRIVVAYGRDAADVALSTTFASCQLTSMQVAVGPAPDMPPGG